MYNEQIPKLKRRIREWVYPQASRMWIKAVPSGKAFTESLRY
jgi:hypothetical protein